jgi:hypothetical protein
VGAWACHGPDSPPPQICLAYWYQGGGGCALYAGCSDGGQWSVGCTEHTGICDCVNASVACGGDTAAPFFDEVNRACGWNLTLAVPPIWNDSVTTVCPTTDAGPTCDVGGQCYYCTSQGIHCQGGLCVRTDAGCGCVPIDGVQ